MQGYLRSPFTPGHSLSVKQYGQWTA